MSLRAWLSVVALVALLPPSAAASQSISGEVSAQSVTLPTDAITHGFPISAFFGDATTLHAFTVHAKHAELKVFQLNRTEVIVGETGVRPQADLSNSSRTYELTNVVVTLQGAQRRGWLGFYPEEATFQVDLVARAPATLNASSATLLGDSATPRSGPEPDVPRYGVEVTSPHILESGAMDAHFTGAASFKLFGPQIHVSAKEGDVTVETGEFRDSDLAAHGLQQRWAFLTISDGSADISSDGLSIIALPAGSVSWSGDAFLVGPRGSLSSGFAKYYADGNPGSISGQMQGVASPDTTTRPAALQLSVEGSLDRTTFPSVASARIATPTGPVLPWLVGGVSLFVLGSVLGVGIQRHRVRSLRLEECVQAAELAAESEDYATALEWMQTAIRLAPRSARLHEDQAFFHAELGNTDEALRAYKTSSELRDDGDADLGAARLLAEKGMPERAVAHAVEALHRTPSLVNELGSLHDLLKEFVQFRQAVRAARERAG